MKRNRFNIWILLLAAGLLAGCAHRNEPSLTTDKEICVRTNVGHFQKGNRVKSIDSSSALQTQDLRIDAYFNGENTAYLSNTKLHYVGGDPVWQFWEAGAQVHYYWPIEGSVYDPDGEAITVSSLDFVGFCPFERPTYIKDTAYATGTGVTFTCDVHEHMTNATQADMDEYLIAVLTDKTYADQPSAGLPLTFKHPFALVKFVIAEGSGTHVQIDSIGIADLNTGGTCVFDGTTSTWSNLTGSAILSIVPATALKYGTAFTVSDTMMVIPNNYGPKTLTVKGTWDDWSDVTKTLSAEVNFNWQAGYIYTYNLTVTPYALKVDTEAFTEQW